MATPPADLPAPLVEALDNADDATLEATIQYATTLLEGEKSADPEGTVGDADLSVPEEWEGDADSWADAIADCEAPARATLTVKTIKGNQYLYWQWSAGGTTKSEYIGPKHPKR